MFPHFEKAEREHDISGKSLNRACNAESKQILSRSLD